jgi:hypothetical protein
MAAGLHKDSASAFGGFGFFSFLDFGERQATGSPLLKEGMGGGYWDVSKCVRCVKCVSLFWTFFKKMVMDCRKKTKSLK